MQKPLKATLKYEQRGFKLVKYLSTCTSTYIKVVQFKCCWTSTINQQESEHAKVYVLAVT